jgi:nitroreductase
MNPSENKMNTMLKLIQNRRSCRAFLPKPVSTDDITSILKAGLWAPTSKNNRPWEYVVVDNAETIKLLALCKPHGAAFLAQAPLAIVVFGDPQKSDVWVEDCSIATTLMQMTVEDLGLGSTWIQVRNRMHSELITASEYIKDLLKAPANLEVAAILSIGYKQKERASYQDDDLIWAKVHKNQF